MDFSRKRLDLDKKPLAGKSCPKMLLYGIGVIVVRYVVWPENGKVGLNDSLCKIVSFSEKETILVLMERLELDKSPFAT